MIIMLYDLSFSYNLFYMYLFKYFNWLIDMLHYYELHMYIHMWYLAQLKYMYFKISALISLYTCGI